MFTKQFWKASLERVVGTFAASFIGLVVVDNSTDYLGLDWGNIFVTSIIITGLTFVKTLAALATNGTPGFTEAERLAPDDS